MSEARLRSDIAMAALVRRAAAAGAAAFVVRRGADEAGAALVKVATLDGHCRVYAQGLREGARIWYPLTGPAPVPEPEGEERIARARTRDPDLWVIEIEDRQGRNFLVEPVVDA